MPRLLKTPAERLLLELCRTSTRYDSVVQLLSDGGVGTLREVEGLAIRHGVQGLVWSCLVDALPDDGSLLEVRQIAEFGLSRLQRQTTFRDLEQDRVLGALAAAGCEPLVLKGGALRRTVFSPLERTMGDLDILVVFDEVTPVLEALETLGYRTEYPDLAREQFRHHHHHERVNHPMGFITEVHWGLTRPRDAIQLDPERYLARSITLEASGSPDIRIPCAEDMLVHTLSQMEQELLLGFRRVIDLDRIARTPDFDWDDACRHADEVGLGGWLTVAVRLAHVLLGTSAPEELLRGSQLSAPARHAIDTLQPVRRLLDEEMVLPVLESHVFRLWCQDSEHRRTSIRQVLAGRRDPLQWVWTGEEAPEDSKREGTTGLLFLLKLAIYQSILGARMIWRLIPTAAARESKFWTAS